MSTLSTHVLDTARGRPAAGIHVTLERIHADGSVSPVGGGVTDVDGRLGALIRDGETVHAGDYRLHFATGPYLLAAGGESFYPTVTVTFRVSDGEAHYHIPLLLSPFGYSTYRGS